jgi:hypothetical protein
MQVGVIKRYNSYLGCEIFRPLMHSFKTRLMLTIGLRYSNYCAANGLTAAGSYRRLHSERVPPFTAVTIHCRGIRSPLLSQSAPS